MTDPLEALGRRAETEPFFLAWLLAAYADSECLDDTGLAAALGCPVGELVMLRLCRAPRSDSAEFWDDVTRLADHFGIEPARLAQVVKRGRVVRRFQAVGGESAGGLLAARDRDPEPPPEQPPEAP
jgi:hypothetical protein